MAVKRYELSDAQWLPIPSLLPGKVTDPGRSGTDNRLFVNNRNRNREFWEVCAFIKRAELACRVARTRTRRV